ncbi:hypothetical protein E5288_WYG016882 [Bos mutus]|uniref:Uncharacterized protein n=1 Tax=Bos mutus TaxID=72004 RepID=A0A6B0RVE2_9CETA|nr:hypothetical protein [Bos mutus]
MDKTGEANEKWCEGENVPGSGSLSAVNKSWFWVETSKFRLYPAFTFRGYCLFLKMKILTLTYRRLESG